MSETSRLFCVHSLKICSSSRSLWWWEVAHLLNRRHRFTEKCAKLIGRQLHVPLLLNPDLVNINENTQDTAKQHLSTSPSSPPSRPVATRVQPLSGGFTGPNSEITTQPHSEQQRRCEYV